MRFSDIAGQVNVINSIIKNVRIGRISHAQMVIGKEGSGNLSLALAYAQFVNCTNKQYYDVSEEQSLIGDSCGVCASCLKSKKLVHPDIHFMIPVVTSATGSKKIITKDVLPQWRSFIIDKSTYVDINQWYEYINVENKQGIISVDDCNDMMSIMNYKTYEGEYKIVIIWMIEKLHYQAAPKILKILEEPPANTLFLLLADNPNLVLDTIMSRVQLIKLEKLSHADIVKYLQNKFDTEKSHAISLADKYDNNLNDIVDDISNNNNNNQYINYFIEWMRVCFKQNTCLILNSANEFRSLGREKQKEFLSFSLKQIRNAWIKRYSNGLMKYREANQDGFYDNFGKYLNENNLKLVYNEINNSINAIERNANPKILFTDISYKIGNYIKY